MDGKRSCSTDNGSSDSKMPKIDTDQSITRTINKPKHASDEMGDIEGVLHPFDNFSVEKVINENSQRKMICILGHFEKNSSEDKAIIMLEKTPWAHDTAFNVLSCGDTLGTIDIKNDIYGTYHGYPKRKYNGIKASIICPASDKHVAKYSAQDVYLVEESPESYKNITLPFLESSTFSIQWVYNILEKKCEADRIVYEDPDKENGFILLPDMKWNRQQVDDLYLVAIVHRHGIKSLRDLTNDHLPLLTNVLNKGQKAIRDKFGLDPAKLRIYIHYQPSYYHLHIHFTHLKYDAPGSSVEKAHLLSDVIDNIRIKSDFYQCKTISFILRENEQLCKKYMEAGIIKRL